ncbi:MAG TPA: oligosaccharide flippase family protein [Vicinamibacterales bacterium]|nr:oligosaccharide flippase family protein [Vicinamibacterales bacterium]
MRTTTRATTGESTVSTTRPHGDGDGGGIRANTCWAFAGNAVYAVCQWLVFVLLVKSLSPGDVGRFAYWTAVTGPIFVMANMRLRNLLAAGVGVPHGFPDYLAARLLTAAVAVCAALVIGIVSGGAEAVAVLALIALARSCDAVSDICHGLFQRELKMRSAATGLMASGLLSAALVGLSLALRPSLRSAAAMYAAGALLALVAWDLPRVRGLAVERGSAPTPRAVWGLIRRGLPLGLSSAIGSVRVNLPRYVVAAYLGPAALAVFTALTHIPTLGNLVVNALSQAALPVLARDLQGSPARYRRRLRVLVALGVSLGLAGLLAAASIGRAVLAWMYRADYADHVGVLLWLMAASAVTYAYLFLGTALTVRMRFGVQCLIGAAGLAAVAGSVVPLVRSFGLTGAACALLAGAIVEGAAYVVLSGRDLAADRPSDHVPRGVLVEGVRS